MIKRIIFDIDGTLLDTEKDLFEVYKEYSKIKNYPDISQKLWDVLDDYEYKKSNPTFDKEEIAEFIRSNLNIDFTKKDLDVISKIYQTTATLKSADIPTVLEELSKHFDLVALSKWYVKDQEERLKHVDIFKYFTKIYGIENAGIKPSKEAFLKASEGYKLEECLIVGDSIKSDIEVPISMGLKALYYSDKQDEKYITINNLKEIKNQIRYMLFEKELSYFKNERIKESAKILLTKLPDYFFYIAASSSGKYHPLCDLGDQGLIRHTKNVIRIGYELLNLEMYKEQFNESERDLILYSLMFHDSLKQGLNETGYTIFEHPLIAADFIYDNKDDLKLSEEEAKYIKDAISSHMGEWNKKNNIIMPKPKTKEQQLIHLCDYIASRNFINIEYDNNENIIEGRRD